MKLLNFFKKNDPKASLENPNVSLSDPAAVHLFGSNLSDAGENITPHNILQVSAVWACVTLISETVAGLPLRVYKRTGRGQNLIVDHKYNDLFQVQPNSMYGAFQFFELCTHHCLTRGDSFSVIDRNGYGDVIAFYPLDPSAVMVIKHDGQLYYRATLADGSYEIFDSSRILHVPGAGFDGLRGYTPISVLRNAAGLAKATEKHGAKLFSNGTNLSMTLETDDKLTDEATQKILKTFNESFRGPDNANKTAILPHGLKANMLTMSNEDAQFLETRKFQVSDIARIFKVPPHMIGDLERSTNNNIEQQNINYYTITAKPWLERFEAEINRKIFMGTGEFAEFDTRRLLRGDFKNRMEGLSKGVNSGIYTPNEAREAEGLNPVEGGDILRVPVNTAPIDDSEQEDREED